MNSFLGFSVYLFPLKDQLFQALTNKSRQFIIFYDFRIPGSVFQHTPCHIQRYRSIDYANADVLREIVHLTPSTGIIGFVFFQRISQSDSFLHDRDMP